MENAILGGISLREQWNLPQQFAGVQPTVFQSFNPTGICIYLPGFVNSVVWFCKMSSLFFFVGKLACGR